AKYVEPNCVAREREVAPFSRRGPGADNALKPELATHGGNVAYTGAGWTTSPRTGVYGLGRDGTKLEYSVGTSYSAPLVAQYAARLFDAYPQATPNLVRALLCHYAKPVHAPAPGDPFCDTHFCGFGEPDVDAALFASDSAVSLLFQGEIKNNGYTYIPFHIPAAFADDERARLTVKGTVVFDPPVSSDDSVQYSLARIAGKLRKRSGDALREVEIGGGEGDVLFPWNPLLHFKHRFRRGYSSGEWEMRLRLMTRGDLPEDYTQSFALVLEVSDDGGSVDVRDAITSENAGLYVPVALQIAA
ncbi:MAG: S8 family serine peptidase, partial [Longimicrobiales bacterium]